MDVVGWLGDFALIGTIAVLMSIGLVIAIRSGVHSARSFQGLRTLAANFWQVVLQLFGFLAGSFILQRFIGFPMGIDW